MSVSFKYRDENILSATTGSIASPTAVSAFKALIGKADPAAWADAAGEGGG